MLLTQSSIRSAGALGMLLVAASAAYPGALAPQKAKADSRMSTAQAQRLMAARSARFVENKGQWVPQARYLARSGNLDLWFTDRGIRYDHFAHGATKGGLNGQVVDMAFVGGRAARVSGRNKLRARIDYYLESARATNVGAYGEVLAQGVLPGVDMRNYFDRGMPRYDLIVAPGTNARAIRLAYKGDSGLSVAKGALRIATRNGGFSNGKPVAYQLVNGKRVAVAANWKTFGNHTAGFALGKYDPRKPLVIDPLIFGTYFGGNDNADEVRAVVADADKNVYFTGGTRAQRFPVLNPGYPSAGDPQGLNINQGGGGGFEDVFVSRVAGDVYDYDYSAFFGGSVDDYGQFIKFDPAGDVWVAGTTASSNFPTNDRGNVQYLFPSLGTTLPFSQNRNKCTFRLIYRNAASAKVPYDASPAEVATALTNLLGPNTVRSVRSLDGGLVSQGSTYRIELIPALPFPITVQSTYVGPSNNPANFGLPASLHTVGMSPNPFNPPNTLVVNNTLPTRQQLREYGSDVSSGNYTLTYTNQDATPVAATTTNILYTLPANYNGIQTVLNALTNHTNEAATVDGVDDSGLIASPPSAALNTNSQFLARIRFASTLTPPNPTGDIPENLITANGNLRPNDCAYTTRQVTDAFVLHLNRNADGTLTPSTNPILIFGSDESDELTGFDVWQKTGATSPSDTVEFVLSGSTTSKLLNYPAKDFPANSIGLVGFLARYTWSLASGFQTVLPATNGNVHDPINDLPYVRSVDGFPVDVHGVALDPSGAAYIGGTLSTGFNYSTGPGSDVFYTSTGIFERGDQVRNYDAFVRKYNEDGTVAYSGVVGGHGYDEAGGVGADLAGRRVNTGSCVALDQFNNLYLTGVSRSFDFPRTRGVYGEVFSDTANVFVTKIDPTGSTLVYSTNLQQELGDSPIIANSAPAGIAVDSRGYAYVTTNLRPTSVAFPVGTPGDPNQPTGSAYPTIPLQDAVDTIYTGPTGADFPTTEGSLTVLNPTATGIALATYLGGSLDDFVFAPSVSPYSDVFAVGWTDSFRAYVRVSSTGTPTIYQDSATFPLITSLAVKQTGDQSQGGFADTLGYGIWGNNPGGIYSPSYINANYSRDGFITEFRVNAASVSNLTFSPTSIPGGLGASTTGTVTLSQGAPSGGGQIVITLPNGTETASLQPLDTDPDAATLSISVPEGATTATFTVYSKPVVTNASVIVRATFEGTFRETAFQVVPWLQRLQLSNDAMVGGDPNHLRGTITLAAPAPAGGVDVALTANPALARILNVPFTVPAGQTSAPFDIDSDGVDANTAITITASLLGVNKTATLTLLPATLQSVTLNPSTVAGGSTSTALVSLNGKAGPAGYDVTLSDNSAYASIAPTTVTIAPQTVSSSSVVVSTLPVPSDQTATITATHAATPGHPAATRAATLTIQSVTIASIAFNPTTIDSGGTSTVTVTVGAAAPTGGARVYLAIDNPTYIKSLGLPTDASNNNLPYVIVPAGSRSVTFAVVAHYFERQQTVTITASQTGTPKSATLTIRAFPYTVTLDNPSVTGSANGSTVVTGTIRLAAAATETLTFSVTSPSPGVTIDNPTVTIQAGSTVGTFTLRPGVVSSATNVAILVGLNDPAGSAPNHSVNLQIKPVGISSLVAQQRVIRSSNGYLDLFVYFSAPTPSVGTVSLTITPNSVFAGARSFTVPAGTSVFQIHLVPNRLSRTQDVTITASYNGTDASTTVTVTR